MNRMGGVVRHVPAAMAEALVVGGTARASDNPGRIRDIALVRTAETSAQRIGEPSRTLGVRFYRWTRLDESATRVIEHHPRSTDYA
jgi:hypothetical protein